jgi:hypothetical protein
VNTKRPVRATSVGDTSRALSDELQRRFIQVHEAKFKKIHEVALLTIQSGSFGRHDTVKSGAEPQPKSRIAQSSLASVICENLRNLRFTLFSSVFGLRAMDPAKRTLAFVYCMQSRRDRNQRNSLIYRILNISEKSLCIFVCNQSIIHPVGFVSPTPPLDASDCSLFLYFQRYESSFFEPPVW